MRRQYLLLCLFFLLSQYKSAAQWSYGVALKLNLSTQLMRYPLQPAEGTFQAGNIATLGGGLFVNTPAWKNIKGVCKLNYIRKGFKLPSQYGEIGSPVYFEFSQVNTFDFIDVDLLVMWAIKKRRIPKPYIGLRAGTIIDKSIGSYYQPFINWDYPKEMHDFEQVTAGWVAGLCINIGDRLSLEIETNIEFLPIIRRADFRSENWVSSINIAYDLSRIKKGK